MPELRKVSGKECIKALSKMGFYTLRQKGSHVTMAKDTPEGKIGTVVPMHKELKIGTLKGILKKAKVSEGEFMEHI